MTRISFIILIAVGLFLAACNNDNKSGQNSADSTSKQGTIGAHDGHGENAEHSGEHVYSCPMHPEVRQSGPGECPKCGMDLEHTDAPANGKKFEMSFAFSPEKPMPGKPVNLILKPTDPENKEADVPLDVEHEKKIHLIITSKDLAYFDHIHPEFGAKGNYTVEHTFPKADEYVLFADFKPSEGGHTTDKETIVVGSGQAGTTEFPTQSLVKNVGGFKVELTGGEGSAFKAGAQAHIAAIITRDGKEIAADKLEDYLGAKAHMVMIRQGSLEFLHVHPGIENNRLDMHTTFEQAGTYRAWLQFQIDGKVQTADFTLKVQ